MMGWVGAGSCLKEGWKEPNQRFDVGFKPGSLGRPKRIMRI